MTLVMIRFAFVLPDGRLSAGGSCRELGWSGGGMGWNRGPISALAASPCRLPQMLATGFPLELTSTFVVHHLLLLAPSIAWLAGRYISPKRR